VRMSKAIEILRYIWDVTRRRDLLMKRELTSGRAVVILSAALLGLVLGEITGTGFSMATNGSAEIPFPHTQHVEMYEVRCFECHQPHGQTFFPAPAVCLGCHSEMGFPHDAHPNDCSVCHTIHSPAPRPCFECHYEGVLPPPHYLPQELDCWDCHG